MVSVDHVHGQQITGGGEGKRNLQTKILSKTTDDIRQLCRNYYYNIADSYTHYQAYAYLVLTADKDSMQKFDTFQWGMHMPHLPLYPPPGSGSQLQILGPLSISKTNKARFMKFCMHVAMHTNSGGVHILYHYSLWNTVCPHNILGPLDQRN